MSKRSTCNLEVIQTKEITPNMVRITLGGSDLADFPPGQESGYIKLMFPDAAGAGGVIDKIKQAVRPTMRTYTIRHFDAVKHEMDVDFVVHGDNGPASKWAMNARVGDALTIAGPGAKKLVNFDADWFFLIGDMTALPAISVNIEKLPRDAKGYCVVEILDEADKQKLDFPDNIDVHWVLNPHPDKENTALLDTVVALPMIDGKPSVWAACEFNTMRALRKHFRTDLNVAREDIYISSYWKMGMSEEEHKVVKSKDAQN
ncbi:MAG: siderophore-interacting protein [Pseudomonadota bacterium]